MPSIPRNPNLLLLVVLIFCKFCCLAAGTPLQISNPDTRNQITPNTEFSSDSIPPNPRFRLPLNVIPSHYTLKQQIVLDNTDGLTPFTAPSEVTITVTCARVTSTITLHRRYQSVTIAEDQVKITIKESNEVLEIESHTYENDNDFYHINLKAPLVAGTIYDMYIPFMANIDTETPFGLSAAPYTDPEKPGETSYLTVTTLEPHYARRVLPCFDEPNLKATFDIILGHTPDYQSLAHTEIARSETEGNWIWDHYERTVKMPTYLLCMIVVSTNFKAEYAPPGLFDKPVGAWADKSFIDAGAGVFAAETSAKSLDYYQKTYDYEYSLSKLDSITVPKFPAGALENWGINTYREDVLLWFPNIDGEADKKGSASTISHEISHQWFGNLVSCIFWDQIWLNEGFANFMAYQGVEATHPEFDPWAQFPSESVQAAMRADHGPNTHPVTFETMPENWMSIFDTISYAKGGSLLRMAEGFLTKDILTKGLIEYLKKMEYKGADQNDLFASLDLAATSAPTNPLPSDLTVKKVLDTWTLQAGYPMVRVTKAGTQRVLLSQEKFSVTQAPSSVLWHIPLNIVTKSSPTPKQTPNFWIRNNAVMVSYAEGIDTSEWIMVNPEAVGFYRVWYDSELLSSIRAQLDLDPTVISPGSRSQLLDDYWNFALAKYDEIPTMLSLTKYLTKETNLVVWSSILGNLRSTFNRLSGSAGFLAFGNYMRPRIEAALVSIGWEQAADAKGSEVILRSLLVDWACGLESEKCLSEAERLFEEFENENLVPVDLQPVYYCGAVSQINQPAINSFLTAYKDVANGDTLKSRFLSAIACATEETVIRNLLTLAMNPAEIRESDRVTLFQKIASNPAGRAIVYEYIKLYLANVGSKLFTSVASTLAFHWHTQAQLDNLEAFIQASGPAFDADDQRSLETTRNTIAANINWMTTTGSVIVQWMTENTN